MIYDVAIVGGGPAAAAAGVYAARKLLRSVIIAESWGGQSAVSSEVQNWIGTVSLSGSALAKALENHVKAYAKDVVDIVEGERVERIAQTPEKLFLLSSATGKELTARAVLLATGASRRKLGIPGAETFEQKGVTYCASCDGPVFSGMDVAVIGGGNAGFETAAQLLAYAKSVTLLHHGEEFKADPVTVEKVLSNPHMKALLNAEPLEVKGETFVSALRYRDTQSGEEKELPVSGIFVEIGIMPNTALVEGLVELDMVKRVKVDGKTQRASLPGIWAAGDCSDGLYHQNNIAAGDAVKAVEDIYVYLKAR